MASVNLVILLGNLTKDPEVRHTTDGASIANLSLATNETWKDKAGNKQERAEFHRVVFFPKLSEVAAQFLRKGMPIYVEGRLQTRKYQDKDGIDRYATEIVGSKLQMLGGKGERQEATPQEADPYDGDIPF